MLRPDVLLVSDKQAAARNRYRVKNKENIEGYLWVEARLETLPLNKPLPPEIPTNDDVYHVVSARR